MNGGDKFLLAAKMRFGKTLTTYWIAKRCGYQKILIITRRPTDTNDAWERDLANHVDFEGWKYTRSRDHQSTIEIDEINPHIIFASLQDLNNLNKPKWVKLLQTEFDLVVYDEYHIGGQTYNTDDFLKKLKYKRLLCVSGTPFKALLAGEFEDNEIFMWDYIDEQKLKRDNYIEYKDCPTMEFHLFEIDPVALDMLTVYDPEDRGFNFTKLLAHCVDETSKTERFIDKRSVERFLDNISGELNHKNMSPYASIPELNHTIWFLPGRAAVAQMAILLRRHPFFRDYTVIPVSANTDEESTDPLTTTQQAIRNNSRTITLSVRKLNVSVTIPELNGVFMMNDAKSPETYFQGAFRCQSSHKDKDKCHLIDFSPQRILGIQYQYGEIYTQDTNRTITEFLKEWLDFCPIFVHKNNEIVKADIERVLKAEASIGDYLKMFSHSHLFDESKAEQFAEVLKKHQAYIHTSETTINETPGLPDTQNFKKKPTEEDDRVTNTDRRENGVNTDNDTPSTKETKLTPKDLVQKAKTITSQLPKFLFVMNNKTFNSIGELLEMLRMDPETSNTFEMYVETSVPTFVALVKSGFIKTKKLNRALLQFNQLIKL
jgi:hypothetical protein